MSQIQIVVEWYFGEIKRISNLFCSNLKWRLIWMQLGKLTLFMVFSKTLEHVYVEIKFLSTWILTVQNLSNTLDENVYMK